MRAADYRDVAFHCQQALEKLLYVCRTYKQRWLL
jgi:HEPN domain-containing protein